MKFGEMRRAKQTLSPEETLAELKGAKRGGRRGGDPPRRRGRPGFLPRARTRHRQARPRGVRGDFRIGVSAMRSLRKPDPLT